MKKVFLLGAMVCALGMMLSCGITDYSGFCDMYIANESGHSVEFEVYDEYGRNPTTIAVPNGGKVKVQSYEEMGYASVYPQRIFLDTVVFRFDDGMNLTCAGTLYEDEYYHTIVRPFSPEDNNVLDVSSWDITRTQKNEHCPLEIGVYTLMEENYKTAEQQTIPLP